MHIKVFLYFFRLQYLLLKMNRAQHHLHAAFQASHVHNNVVRQKYQKMLNLSIKFEHDRIEVKRLMQDKGAGKKLLPIPNITGEVEITSLAKQSLVQLEIQIAMERHKNGDWGNISLFDWISNNKCLVEGGTITSRYKSSKGVDFLITTNELHTKTKIMLEEECK